MRIFNPRNQWSEITFFYFSKYRGNYVYHLLQRLEALHFETQHIYAFSMILTLNTLHSPKQCSPIAFIMNTKCVLRKVGTEI